VRKRGISILLVEQKLAIALDISERLYVMGHGRIVFEGTPGRPAEQRSHAQGMAGSVISTPPTHTTCQESA
jgi:branched-chain amino acid transport system ATP-binding protein